MVYEVFARLINRSITASVVIIAVLIARCFMGRLPKKYSYIVWGIVAVRLLCPVGIPSSFSVFNLVGEHEIPMAAFQENSVLERDKEQQNNQNGNQISDLSDGEVNTKDVSWKYGVSEKDTIKNQADIGGRRQNQKSDHMTEIKKSDRKFHAGSLLVKYGAVVWLVIAVLLAAWNFLLMVLMKRKVLKAVWLRDNIYECDYIPTPFVMGFIKPRIYIPFRLTEEEQAYIIRHEQHHIARKDNVIKLIAFFITCVYWFHPLVWLSYFLMVRDMEMSCDEYVLQKSVRDIRKDYSQSLLGFAINQRNMGAGLIAFGESSTRRRVKHIMRFKKCGKWIGMIAVGVVLMVGAVCLTDEKKGDADDFGKVIKNNAKPLETGKPENQSKEQYAVVAKANILGYRVEIQCVTGKKSEEIEGYYEEDSVMIQTALKDEVIDRHEVTFAEDGKLYFPVGGFEIHVADYDGDGKKNDFALGQGQTPYPLLGNWMSYRFFGVEKDGTVVDYHTSTENGISIVTIPGEYSPLFVRKDGELKYNGLSENGGIEKTSTSIVKYITVEEVRTEKPEPMSSIMNYIEENMPSEVVEELQKKGVWHISTGKFKEMMQYNLANGENNDDITLRLDFTYVGGQLVVYSSKEYGFTDKIKKPAEGDWYIKLINFARDFTGMEFKYIDEPIEDLSVKKKESVKYRVIGHADLPARWNDGHHEYFKDEVGSTYLMDNRINMIVGYTNVKTD